MITAMGDVMREAYKRNWITTRDGNVRKFDIVGQKNHGVCAVGKNPWEAFEHIERVEHICQIVLASGVQPPGKKNGKFEKLFGAF
jgi:hypothetical protein